MFNRRRNRSRYVTLIALCAVIFAALMPATSSFARMLSSADVVALGGICTTHEGEPATPADRVFLHGHCAFCSLGAPLVSMPRVDVLLATLDAPLFVSHLPRNDVLPRDVASVHPLVPRAPPRVL